MKKLLLLAGAVVFAASFGFAQQAAKSTGTAKKTSGSTASASTPFEGTIDFIQYNGTDTSHYKYFVKGNNVKVDNYDPNTKNIEGSFLIDLTTKKMTAISPVRKIYFDQPSGAAVKPGGKPTAKKTGATKKINGYMCSEYLVIDADEGTKIHFWMASGHFDFFVGMLQILNRKDKFSEYYLQIASMQGMFPMLATMEDLGGVSKGFMQAVKVEKSTVSDDTFKVPAGYKEFKK